MLRCPSTAQAIALRGQITTRSRQKHTPRHRQTTMEASRRQRLQEMVSELKLKFPDVPNIIARDVQNARQSSDGNAALVLVDVRTAEEVAVSRLPGALTAAEFEAQQEQFKQQGATVVPYCTIGYRSSQYAQKLQQEGFAAKNLEGSIVAWTQEGLPLVSGSGEAELTQRVHVFAKRWELQGDGYEAVVYSRPLAALAGAWLRGAWQRWLGGTGS